MSTEVQTKVQASPVQSFTPAQTGLLQKKSALCNTPGLVEDSGRDKEKLTLQRSSVDQAGIITVPRFGHDFSRVSMHSTGHGMIQTKLKINKPGDIYEQEADSVADAVMRMPEPVVQREVEPEEEEEEERLQTKPLANQITPLVQRQPDPADEEEEEEETIQAKPLAGHTPEVTPAISSGIQSLDGGGQPLSGSERRFFESRFRADFSNVRIHNDTLAVNAARSVNARAFAFGNNVVFGAGEYSSDTLAGRKLFAHELTHVVQQSRNKRSLQRMPYDLDSSTALLHESIEKQYCRETGKPFQPGIRFSPGYAAWLEANTPRIQFIPPIEEQVNPLERFRQRKSAGTTIPLINGKNVHADKMPQRLSNMLNEIMPTVIKSEVAFGSLRRCRFDPVFKLDVGTKIIVPTPPDEKGWKAKLSPAALNNPPQCIGKAEVETTLRGDPDDRSYQKLIRDGELEHVQSIRVLYKRHLVPYYNFVMGLSSIGASDADCNIQQQLGRRAELAAMGFILGDMAESKRFDDPGSTHFISMSLDIDTNCNTATLTSKQKHPQQEGRKPGNVRKIPPTVRNVDPAKLNVSGSNLLSNGNVIHSFTSSANATFAMNMMMVHKITEIRSIGPFHIALSNGVPPILSIAGIHEIELDLALIQVSTGLSDPEDWVISQVKRNKISVIVNFGANRDQAYSALELLRQFGFTHQMLIGPDFTYYRKA